MVDKLILTHEEFLIKIQALSKQVLRSYKPTVIIALANGGIVPAAYLYRELDLPSCVIHSVKLSFYDGETKRSEPLIDHDSFKSLSLKPTDRILIVDDLIDSGSTICFMKNYLQDFSGECKVAVLYTKPHATVQPDYVIDVTDKWVVFPWE